MKEETPHVLVVVTAYNSGQWLVDALVSYQRQTYPNRSLVVIDDGSRSEKSKFIAREVQKIDGAYYTKQNNQGLSAARNYGVQEHRGDYVAFLDHDDIWEPEFLSRLVKELQSNHDLNAVFSRVEFIGEDGTKQGKQSHPKLEGIVPTDFLVSDPTSCGSSILINRDVFQKLGGFNAAMKRAEIPEFFIRFLLTGYKVKGVDAVLVQYRDVTGSLSKGFSLFKFRLRTWWLLLRNQPGKGMNPFIVSRFLANQCKIILRGYGCFG